MWFVLLLEFNFLQIMYLDSIICLFGETNESTDNSSQSYNLWQLSVSTTFLSNLFQ